jgi:hypothetical protein
VLIALSDIDPGYDGVWVPITFATAADLVTIWDERRSGWASGCEKTL